MIIELWNGKIIKDNGKCNNCKYNVGQKVNNPDIIWCDKHLKNIHKNESCEQYIYRYKEEHK